MFFLSWSATLAAILIVFERVFHKVFPVCLIVTTLCKQWHLVSKADLIEIFELLDNLNLCCSSKKIVLSLAKLLQN